MAVTFLSLYAQAREIAPTTEGKKDAQFPLLEGVMEGDMPLSQAFIGVRPILRNACESKGHEGENYLSVTTVNTAVIFWMFTNNYSRDSRG